MKPKSAIETAPLWCECQAFPVGASVDGNAHEPWGSCHFEKTENPHRRGRESQCGGNVVPGNQAPAHYWHLKHLLQGGSYSFEE
jgi:hypothetical protein